jgi:hypothetical protein
MILHGGVRTSVSVIQWKKVFHEKIEEGVCHSDSSIVQVHLVSYQLLIKIKTLLGVNKYNSQ